MFIELNEIDFHWDNILEISSSVYICLFFNSFLIGGWLPQWLRGKESTCNAEDMGSIPGSGRSPGEGNGNLLQCSHLENSTDKRSLAGYSPWSHKRVWHNWVTEYTHNWRIIALQRCAGFRHTWISHKYTCVCMLSRFSCVLFFVTLCSVEDQAPLSMGFPRQEYWSGLPCPPPLSIPKYTYISRVFCSFKLSAFICTWLLIWSIFWCILKCVFYTYSTSQFKPVTFRVLRSHMWLVATVVDGTDSEFWRESVWSATLEADCVQVCTEIVQQVTLIGMWCP